MFRRDIKKQFNNNKYNNQIAKGIEQHTHMTKVPFQKHMIGYCALVVLGFNVTKRYYTLPHHHKDESKPMLMYNGELHPYEFKQPKGAADKYQTYSAHEPLK